MVVAVAAALTLGGATGVGGVALLAGSARGEANALPSLDPDRLSDVTHLPPLLRSEGERVTLRYDIYCTAPDGDPESGAPCDAGGTVYLRAGAAGPFRSVPLRLDAGATEGRYAAPVPSDVAASPDGFSYYAVVRNERTGATLRLPPGGAAAPHTSVSLGAAVAVDLGRHVFGRPRPPDARVFAAGWGSGSDEVGLEGGGQTTPIGPSAFDVDERGIVTVLDQANRRLLRLQPGGRRDDVSIAVDGALADMSVADDGSVYVLESTGAARGEPPLLRTFAPDGRLLAAVATAERTAAQVRASPLGPVVKQYPAEQWMPVLRGRTALAGGEQAALGRAARPLRDGREVTVLRRGDELRLSLRGPRAARRSWVVRSETRLGEVQLAEPYGSRLVVVVRVAAEDVDEFAALVLGPRGLERRFAVASTDWAETAPLTRFRLAQGSLYRLGSTPAGVHVDRFALEVTE
jgi:hypothetical protein